MPGMLQNIPVFEADGVMIDLEDAVPLAEKDAARLLDPQLPADVRGRGPRRSSSASTGSTRSYALDDLREVLPARPDGIRLPKADTPEVVERLDTLLTEYEEKLGLRDRPLLDHAVDRERGRRAELRQDGAGLDAGSSRSPSARRTTPRRWRSSAPRRARSCSARARRWSGRRRRPASRPSTRIFADVNDMDGLRARDRAGQAARLHRQVAGQPAPDRGRARGVPPEAGGDRPRARGAWRRSSGRARWAPASSRCAARWWTRRW